MFARTAGVLVLLMVSIQPAFCDFPEFTGLVESASPAVVNIRATKTSPRERAGRSEEEVPEIFRRFLRQPDRNERPGVGSGFIIESDGYILTNNHVVEDASEIVVSLADRRERVASVVGTDPQSDLALLKIEEANLPTVEIGNSESLQAGQWVIAIGSPFDFEMSVTAGIVSATGRSLQGEAANYVPFIQTDVAINPGNSGGPLVNGDGQVIGINTLVRSGPGAGLGFAIPINLARRGADQLQQQGEVVHPYIGLQLVALTPRIAREHNKDPNALVQLPERSGALVQAVLPDGPAEKAGLRRGDLLITVDERDIADPQALLEVVDAAAIDVPLPLKVLRAGRELTLSVKPEPLPGMA